MKMPFHASPGSRCQHGFTAIELLVVMAILGILTALAAPGFMDSINRYRVNGVRDNITSAMQWARSEAIRRRLPVVMERLTGCGVVLVDTNDWGCGWQVYVDADSTNTFTAGDTVLQTFDVPTSVRVSHTALGVRMVISRFGQATISPQTFLLTPPEGPPASATTTVCINAAGRIQSIKGVSVCP